MTGAFAKCKGNTRSNGTGSGKPAWILRCLAGIVQRLALVVCENRLKRSRSKSQELSAGRDQQSQSSAVASFLTGGRQTWKPPQRRDGFLLDDLGRFLDEDGCQPEEDQINASEPSLQRRIASSIVMWTRHDLQSSSPMSRHLAHVAIVHGLTVLSTRVKDLLPHVHDIWQQLVPSFSQDVSVAAQADACVLLKHVARLSGDFIRRRFVEDCWDGLWLRLRRASPVMQNASVSSPSSELKLQSAAVDVLAFLSGDSSLVQTISKQLLAIAMKFLGRGVAHKLRGLAWVLAEQMVIVDPDLAWLFVQVQDAGPGSDWSGVLLLEEVGATALSEEDQARFRSLVLREDEKLWCPRVGLGAGGELWRSFMAGKSPIQGCQSDASDSDQSEEEKTCQITMCPFH